MGYLNFISLGILISTIYGGECFKKNEIHVPTVVNHINSLKNNPWKADTYGFNYIKKSELQRLVRAHLHVPVDAVKQNDSGIKLSAAPEPSDSLPEYFNWVTSSKTNCPIGNIRDQAACGSCWAVSTASAFSDRVCIKSGGKIRTPLSGNYIAACDTSNYGCYGGYMDRVGNFVKNTGVITGGEYESDEGCQPYSIRPCGFPSKFPCLSNFTPKCKSTTCTNEWYGSKKETKIYKAKSWSYINYESNIMKEIYTNGPLTAGFWVYSDFHFYKKGIYVPTPRSYPVGGHAVKVVGWGIENNIKYWIVSNSWSQEWGENGFFRIKRGSNVCKFESMVTALIPDI